MIAPHLIIDLRCLCGYNVRSLAIDGVCAECGFPIPDLIFRTKAGHCADAKAFINEQRRAKRRQKYEPLATKTGCTIDAFLFVVDAIRHSYRRGSLTGRDFNANDLCAALERYARFHFHHDFREAEASLNEWRLRRSEDLGVIIFALTEAKLLRPSEAIREQDFAGRFTLATLFKSIDPM